MRGLRGAGFLAALLGSALAACDGPAAPAAVAEVRAPAVAVLPESPDDRAWDRAPTHHAELRMQDMVEPRKLKPGVAQLHVQALTNGSRIALRLAWTDPTVDDVRRPGAFSDACAVQLPAVPSVDLPAPQMGERGRAVEISFWSAADQAIVDGRRQDIPTLYPNARIDHYPFEAPSLDPEAREKMARLYSPAGSLGNASSAPPPATVRDLMAQGPGTLVPAPTASSAGRGRRTGDGWRVVISRSLPKGAGPRTHVAFAVWNGADEDAASRKMWTPWIALVPEAR